MYSQFSLSTPFIILYIYVHVYHTIVVETSSVELQAFPNGTSKLFTPWGYRSEMHSEPHVGLELTNPVQAEMFFTPMGWRATSGHLSTLVEWKYGILGDIRAPERLIERQLWVNYA